MSQIDDKEAHLKARLQEILKTHSLEYELRFIANMSSELLIDASTCAAALMKLMNDLEQPTQIQSKDPKSHPFPVRRGWADCRNSVGSPLPY